MFSKVICGSVIGVDAVIVHVETDMGRGMQLFQVVGLPDGAVREARVRVKSAIENACYEWPMRRLSVNLAPADLRKDGTLFDLPIAMSVLVAAGEIPERFATTLDHYLVAGELSLDGNIRPIRGMLPLAVCARDAGLRGVIVPAENAAEAAVVSGIEVIACRHLVDAIRFVRGEGDDLRVPTRPADELMLTREYLFDFSEVRGQEPAKRALEVAAAGGHNVLMVGPPGSGKTMLSKRVLSILPEMAFEEALETTKVHSVVGLAQGLGLVAHRPFRAPHHTISDIGMIGGGAGLPRPGEVSLAHHGILFLDELPEFRRNVLEVLRQPLEDGTVTITRSLMSVNYPAKFMLVASMNPCPCGFLGDPTHHCSCTEIAVQLYRNRISGPLLDRIDIHAEVPAVRYRDLREAQAGESSAQIRERVNAARARQRERYAGTGIFCNAQMTPKNIEQFCQIDAAGHKLLERVIDRLGLSARAFGRILKVSRTIADLAASDRVEREHISEAVQYRKLDRSRQAPSFSESA